MLHQIVWLRLTAVAAGLACVLVGISLSVASDPAEHSAGVTRAVTSPLAISTAVAAGALISASRENGSDEEISVWIGTGRNPQSRGIYRARLNPTTGVLSVPELAAEADGPVFLAMHPNRDRLYAVCHVAGRAAVAAFAIEGNGRDATLRFVNSVEIGDGPASHVSIDATGRTLLTAQYGGGSVGVFSLAPNGDLLRQTQLIRHDGRSGVVADRQDAPHAHWTGMSPDNHYAFVPDLGIDRVVIYRLNAADSGITRHGVGVVPPGSGPRHMKFHPGGKKIFVLNELSLTITVFAWDAQSGTMTALQTVETVPEELKAKEKTVSASEIRVHPSGRFVYAANRGHDTISVFSVDASTGLLTLTEREPVRGATPRNFNLDPSGSWLLAAGQDSHTLAVFQVDPQTGELMYHGSIVSVPAPICILCGPES